jgi:hypothetical protein
MEHENLVISLSKCYIWEMLRQNAPIGTLRVLSGQDSSLKNFKRRWGWVKALEKKNPDLVVSGLGHSISEHFHDSDISILEIFYSEIPIFSNIQFDEEIH